VVLIRKVFACKINDDGAVVHPIRSEVEWRRQLSLVIARQCCLRRRNNARICVFVRRPMFTRTSVTTFDRKKNYLIVSSTRAINNINNDRNVRAIGGVNVLVAVRLERVKTTYRMPTNKPWTTKIRNTNRSDTIPPDGPLPLVPHPISAIYYVIRESTGSFFRREKQTRTLTLGVYRNLSFFSRVSQSYRLSHIIPVAF